MPTPFTSSVSEFRFSSESSLLWLCRIFASFLLIALIAPLALKLPAMGLDPSWQFGMQEALARQLLIGSDIVFTFGPYASLYTGIYHPETDVLTICSGLYLGTLFSALFLMYYWRLPSLAILFVALLFCVLLAVSRDSLLFTYPLLLALTLYSITDNQRPGKAVQYLFIACLSGLGLLPLIKGSLLPLCAGISFLCFALAWIERLRSIALACLWAPSGAAMVLWVFSGQPGTGILPYLHNLLPIISGYTNAMATYGALEAIITYLISGTVILLSLLFSRHPWQRKVFLTLCFALFLFISFKAAFVRVDHIVIALGALLIAILLAARHTSRAFWLVLAGGGLALALKVHSYDITDVRHNLINRYSSAIVGIAERIASPTRLQASYALRLRQIARGDPIGFLPGTSDIYPWDQSSLIASGNLWSPRPIFQSYSAYTPALALANEEHLRASNSPDNVILKVQSIDARPPTMEDGVSWPTILHNYSPMAVVSERVIFRQRERKPVDLNSAIIESRTAHVGETVPVPASAGIIFARIKIKQTQLGNLNSLLFKSSGLSLHVKLHNGSQRTYRFIPGMAESGFILSPIIENTFDLVSVANNQAGLIDHKAVENFTITADAPGRDWQNDIRIDFIRLSIPDGHLPMDDFFDAKAPTTHEMLSPLQNASCAGHLDIINSAPAATVSTAGDSVEIEGWTALSTQDGTLPEKVFITLTDNSGATQAFLAKRVARPDVRSYFNKSKLIYSGFRVLINTQHLKGTYVIGVLRSNANQFERCPLMEQPITLH